MSDTAEQKLAAFGGLVPGAASGGVRGSLWRPATGGREGDGTDRAGDDDGALRGRLPTSRRSVLRLADGMAELVRGKQTR
jgi:hypothetical protein